MRLGDLTRGHERDPLFKIGVGAMIVALGFAIVVAVAASLDRPMKVAVAETQAKSSAHEQLVRTDPGINPWVEKDIPPPKPRAAPKRETRPVAGETRPVAGSRPIPRPDRRTEPQPTAVRAARPYLPPEPGRNQTAPTGQTNPPDHYHLPPGAIMALSIPDIGLRQVPVLDSDTSGALDRGVIHLPDTSLPWSDTPERNVYVAGHRLGWPGTGSHLVFYRLDELTGGEKIVLRRGNGRRYEYRVLESFIVGPHDDWVTGRVRGRDLLTLQTCTPIPTFEKRLIVRAERM